LKNNRYLGYTTSYGRKNIINQLSGSKDLREDIIIPNTHPPILDKEVFLKAQEIFEKRRVTPGKGKPKPLTRRLKCGVCGANYNVSRTLKNDSLWRCNNQHNDQNLCSSPAIYESDVLVFFEKAANLRFSSLSSTSLNKILSLLKNIDETDSIEEERISFYKRIQDIKRNSIGVSMESQSLLLESIEAEFLAFENNAAKLEEDHPLRENLLSILTSGSSFYTWTDFTLKMVRGLLREILIFDKSSALLYWADGAVTPLGNPPLTWPIRPIEENFRKAEASGGRFQTLSKQQFSLMPPMVVSTKHNPLIPKTIDSVNKLRVAAYCRTSTQQEKQEKSLAIQVSYFINMIIGNNKWTLVDIYADDGITGTNISKRLDFNRMIQDCHKGKIDLIITKSISRL